MAGLFFTLHLLRVQGFYFAPLQYSHIQAFTAAFLSSMQNYTAKTPKPFTGIYSGVSVDLLYSSARNTAATQTAYTPTTQRWRAYRQVLHLHQYQIPPPCRTLYRGNVSTYYNNVYKGAAVRPCRGSMPGSAT